MTTNTNETKRADGMNDNLTTEELYNRAKLLETSFELGYATWSQVHAAWESFDIAKWY